MRGPGGARSVATMSMRLTPLLAATALAASAAPAQAAVYGGTTSAGDSIVITANRSMTKLTSAVVSSAAGCDNDMRFPFDAELRPATVQPGFSAGPDDLVMSRNAKGRFSGTSTGTGDAGDATAGRIFSLDGKLSAKRASGTLSGTVTILDKATGNTVTSCQTGRLRWAATRAPGHVFGGTTSQNAP